MLIKSLAMNDLLSINSFNICGFEIKVLYSSYSGNQ
jgi:hypothetical protein